MNATDTPEFKRWFAGSQVVDEKGRPLMVYHGTGTEISTFEPGRAGAIYFTPRKAHAEGYGPVVHDVYLRIRKLADLTDPRSDAYRLAVKVFNESDGWSWNDDAMEGRRHPRFDPKKDLTWEIFDSPENNVDAALLQAGYDGVKLQEYGGDVSYAVFDPTQIKSATGNRGTFDPTDPDIRNPLRGAAARERKSPMKTKLLPARRAELNALWDRGFTPVLRQGLYELWHSADADKAVIVEVNTGKVFSPRSRQFSDLYDMVVSGGATTVATRWWEGEDGFPSNPVKPRRGESERDFISRCMSEEKPQFPKQKQRLAVCFSKARPNPLVPDDTNRKAASMSV